MYRAVHTGLFAKDTVHIMQYYYAYPILCLIQGISVCIPHFLWTKQGKFCAARLLNILDIPANVEKYNETLFQRKQVVVLEILQGYNHFNEHGVRFFLVQLLNCAVCFGNMVFIDYYMKTELFGLHMVGILKYKSEVTKFSINDILFPRLAKCSYGTTSPAGTLSK